MIQQVDVVVVGSGAAGMAAALRAAQLGLSVLVVEKSPSYGGTSAVSGGSVWVPNSQHPTTSRAGDDEDSARAYLRACTKGAPDDALLETYATHAPRMLAWLEESTPLRFSALEHYADYHQHQPGAMTGYRTLEPFPFDGALLGEDFERLRPPLPSTLALGRVAMTARQARDVVIGSRKGLWDLTLAMLRYALDLPWRLRTPRDRRLTLGSALMGGLRAALKGLNVPLWLNTPLTRLVQAAPGGRVTGVEVQHEGQLRTISARRAVVLAAGGFEANTQLRERHLPSPTRAEWTATPSLNSGDALSEGVRAGATLGHMDQAWFAPTVASQRPGIFQALFIERAFPGVIAVNKLGRRFVNEACAYNEFVVAMYQDHLRTGACVPAWMIFDATFRRRYPFGPLLPGSFMPDWRVPRQVWEHVRRADSLEALARAIEVDPQGLQATVSRVNDLARRGVDEDFGKGGNPFDVYYGDPRHVPNPCLAPLETPPFYAVPVWPGDIGTCGGLRINARAQVLSEAEPIPGLFAAGNSAASITGGGYPGAGATLGPALVFGMLAAEAAAQLPPQEEVS